MPAGRSPRLPTVDAIVAFHAAFSVSSRRQSRRQVVSFVRRLVRRLVRSASSAAWSSSLPSVACFQLSEEEWARASSDFRGCSWVERFDRRGTEPFELFRSEFGQNSFKNLNSEFLLENNLKIPKFRKIST